MSQRKSDRHARIMEIVAEGRVGTQTALARRLKTSGFPCTQACVSRDIRELGLVKRNGRYGTRDESEPGPNITELAETVRAFLVDVERVGDFMVVAKTFPGMAHSFGVFLDRSRWPGLVGTIAGDDTLFIAVRNRAAAKHVERHLLTLLEERAA